MRIFPPQTHRGRAVAAFTLIEMLVVIAIIAILMTAASTGLSNIGGKSVTSGVTNAESLFDEARNTAVGRNLRSCVLVAKELTNQPADDLRRIIVAYELTKEDGTAKDPTNANPSWVISSRGLLLPDRTFFSSKFSKLDQIAGTGEINTIDASMLKDVSGNALKNSSPLYGSYYIYPFNSQGILLNLKDASFSGASSFVIGSGSRVLTKSSATAPPRVTASGLHDFGGFVIWHNGRTSLFHSPDQIGPGIQSLKSGATF